MRLLHNLRAYAFDPARRRFIAHDSLLIDGERIVAIGQQPHGIEVERIDLEGATIVPAFTDCHVHLAEAGYYAGPRSLANLRDYDEFARAVARIPRDGEIVYAGQYDDATWEDGRHADAAALDRYHAESFAMLVRVDSHSSIVNRKTLAWLNLPAGTQGIERDNDGVPTGRLFLDANWRAIAAFVARIPTEVRRASERRAAEMSLRKGIVAVHAQLLGRTADGYAEDLAFLRTLPVTVHPKICEPDASLAVRFGLPAIGGDVFLDGSIGSCTAALDAPYEGSDDRGALRFSDDELLAYFAGAEGLGVAAGVHAIGDAAIEQCVRTWERVLGGKPSPRGTRHFIEHFEMADASHIEACAVMNLHLSMQPQFQATWGGERGMYERRLGKRYSAMNRLRSIVASGATLCGGSDAPVCALDALEGMRAACDGQEPHERLTVHEALAAYTVNAAHLGYVEERRGNIAPGFEADFAVLDADPFERDSFQGVGVMATWQSGALTG